MKKTLILAIVTTVLTPLFFPFTIIYDNFLYDFLPFELWTAAMILGIASAITAFCAWVTLIFTAIFKKKKKKPSPFLIFGIVDVILGIAAAVYAIVDIATDTGMFAGLAGTLILILVVPIFIVLLITDIIAYAVHKNKSAKSEK